MATVTIARLDESDPASMLHIYPRQSKPQGCFLELDLSSGTLSADWNGEVGNAVPEAVYHGRIRRYSIPPLQPGTVNALLEQMAPLAQRILDGATIEHDGNNRVGELDVDGEAAEMELEYQLQDMESDLHWTDDLDLWFQDVLPEVKTRLLAGESIDTLMAEYDGDGSDDDCAVLIGLRGWLENLADEARDEAEEVNA